MLPKMLRAVAAVAGPQIVNVGLNHWIVAVGCVRDPVVQVFDSSTSSSRKLSLGRVVSALYVLEDEHVAKRVVSVATPQQAGSHDCGLFAIAMQDRILRETQYDIPFDQSKMRKHLADCLRAKKMQPFPVLAASRRGGRRWGGCLFRMYLLRLQIGKEQQLTIEQSRHSKKKKHILSRQES